MRRTKIVFPRFRLQLVSSIFESWTSTSVPLSAESEFLMLRVIIVFAFIIVPSAEDLTPGVDARGVMVNSSTVIIGVVEGPWERVIRTR